MADDLIDRLRRATEGGGPVRLAAHDCHRLVAAFDDLTARLTTTRVRCEGCGRLAPETAGGRCVACWAAEAGRLRGQRDAVVPLPVAMRAEDISEGDVAALREAAKSTPRVVERLKAAAFGDAAGRDAGGNADG